MSSRFTTSLEVPSRLDGLINAGRWPRNSAEAMAQNLRPLVPRERVQTFAPDESEIHLFAPPFYTVAERGKQGEGNFWMQHGALGEIDPKLALVLADFGLGSDTAIILDYRHDPPAVMRLVWSHSGKDNHWVYCCKDFDAFAHLIGLDT